VLAYILWHRPRRSHDAHAFYESAIATFHDRLKKSGIPGFVAPWLGAGDAYEDWYICEGWGDIECLNHASMQGDAKSAHDLSASSTTLLGAAMYKLRHGTPDLRAGTSHWVSKPEGMAYWAIDEHLQSIVAPGISTWQRQLFLGVSPEFCVLGPSELTLPGVRAWKMARKPIGASSPIGTL
jgi:hypothetical protein